MECYYRRKPRVKGNQQRMLAIWWDICLIYGEAYGPVKSDKKEAIINKIRTWRNTEKNKRLTTWLLTYDIEGEDQQWLFWKLLEWF